MHYHPAARGVTILRAVMLLCRQPWSVFELKLPDDGGKRALDWSQKLGMDWLYFKLQEHFKRISTQQS